MSVNELLFLSGFIAFVLILLALDLGVFHKKDHIISFKEATIWSIIWISIGLSYYVFLIFHADLIHGLDSVADIQKNIDIYGHPIKVIEDNFDKSIRIYNNNIALEYLTGYLIEKSLSVDNIFVIIMIFAAFGVKQKYYHKVLFWGIIGAIVLRFLFIFISGTLILHFAWILYIFGAFLIFTGIKMFVQRNKSESVDPKHHPMVKLASKFFRVLPRYVEGHFFVRNKFNHKLWVTPLFIALLVIEFSDLIFAVDSIPAIFAVTKDPYVVFTSNIFAILGLRALFFLLANVMNVFHYLKVGLAVLLTFIGVKMLTHIWLKEFGFTTLHSLIIIIGILTISIVASLVFPQKSVDSK